MATVISRDRLHQTPKGLPRPPTADCRAEWCRPPMNEPVLLQYPFLSLSGRGEVFLMPLHLNPIANRLYACWQWFSMVRFSRFLAEFYANPPLCNTQQGYSPPEEGESSAVSMKIRATGFATHTSAKAKNVWQLFLLLGENKPVGFYPSTSTGN